jgi:hypothetical protein
VRIEIIICKICKRKGNRKGKTACPSQRRPFLGTGVSGISVSESCGVSRPPRAGVEGVLNANLNLRFFESSSLADAACQ